MSTASNDIIKAHEKGLNATITLHGAGGEFAVECPDAEVRQFIEEGSSLRESVPIWEI